MDNTARNKEKMISGELRRGAVKLSHKCYMSESDFREDCKRRLSELMKEKEKLYIELGSPNKANLRKYRGNESKHRNPRLVTEYFSVTDSATEVISRLGKLNSERFGRNEDVRDTLISILKRKVSHSDWIDAKKEASRIANNKRMLKESDWIDLLDKVVEG